jgi:hypothetical protein
VVVVAAVGGGSRNVKYDFLKNDLLSKVIDAFQ